MVFLILNIFLIPSLWISKYFFKKWINPLSLYSIIWYFMLTFYHLKLVNYIDLSPLTWYVIIASHLALFLGSITFFLAKNSFPSEQSTTKTQQSKNDFIEQHLKTFFYLSLIFGLIGLGSALQVWFVLIKLFHSIVGVLFHLGKVYQMRVSGELKGIIPFLSVFIFASIFFSAVYSAYFGKIKLISLLPLASLIIKHIALVSRASILLGFLEYGLTFIFVYYFLSSQNKTITKKGKTLLLQLTILGLIFILSAVAIKNLRGAAESLSGETRTLRKLEDSPFLSPSIYLYLSGHVGTLEKFLSLSKENTRFGENTFLFIYSLLGKLGMVKKPSGYQQGYYIPVWINTGTYIRELIADYTFPGALLFIYFLGLFVSFSWIKFFYEGDLLYLSILVFFSLIVVMSFLVMITRLTNWYLSLIFITAIIQIIKKHKFRDTTELQLSENKI